MPRLPSALGWVCPSLPGESNSLYSSPLQPVCRMRLESPTLDLFPNSVSLIMIYMVNQMGCFPVFCEKTPRTPFVFLPLEGFDLLPRIGSQDDISQSTGARCLCPSVVRRDRSILRPNISVSLSKSLLLTKPPFPRKSNGSAGVCSDVGR